MKIKLLMINLQNPNETKYMNDPKDCAFYLLGRRVSNYVAMAISKHRKHIIEWGNFANVTALQEHINAQLEAFEKSNEESEY